MPVLLSFNFKLMSEHPFHFPMGVLTLGVFYCSEEVCRIIPLVTPNNKSSFRLSSINTLKESSLLVKVTYSRCLFNV